MIPGSVQTLYQLLYSSPLDPCTAGSSCAWQSVGFLMQARGEFCSVNGGTALSSGLEAAPLTSEAV